MDLSKEELEKELDELLVSLSNNIDEPAKAEFKLRDLLSAAIGSRAAMNMLKVINDHNIAQDGVDPGMDVIHDLKVALEKQRILDEERKAQLLKELAETGWKPERREKKKRN